MKMVARVYFRACADPISAITQAATFTKEDAEIGAFQAYAISVSLRVIDEGTGDNKPLSNKTVDAYLSLLASS